MKNKISNAATFLYKFFISPLLLLIVFGFTIAAILVEGVFGLSFLALSIVLFLVFKYSYFDAKEVFIDDKYLYVTNFRKEIQIPFEEVKLISENNFLNPRRITIELLSESEFGNKIVFIGQIEIALFFRPHPTVIELRKKIVHLT